MTDKITKNNDDGETEDGEIDESSQKDDNFIKNKTDSLKKPKKKRKNTFFSNNDDDDDYKKGKKRRKSRWDKKTETLLLTKGREHKSFSGVITDLISSSQNVIPKNITMSQFKKYSEISVNQREVMTVLREAVRQSVEGECRRGTVVSYSDSEILEMIPHGLLEGLFELERTQFIMLYREALNKGVIIPNCHNKTSKAPLLPTPKSQLKLLSKSANDYSPESPNKESSADTSDTDDFSDKGSIISRSSVAEKSSPKIVNESISVKSKNDKIDKVKEEQLEISSKKIDNDPKLIDELISTKVKEEEKEESKKIIDDSVNYRESVNRLHSIYSSMYHASIKMKELENNLQSAEYQSAYGIYSENYTEYQRLYSSLQTAVNVDSVVVVNSEKSDVTLTPRVVNDNVERKSLVNQEQASSTISPTTYAPDSTESFNDNNNSKSRHNHHTASSEVSQSQLDLHQYGRQSQLDNNINKFGYLWISNLCKDTRTADLCKLFGAFGHVSKIKLFQYKAQTPISFFSLVFMPNFSEAETAYRELQNTTLFDRHLHIKMLENDPLSDEQSLIL